MQTVDDPSQVLQLVEQELQRPVVRFMNVPAAQEQTPVTGAVLFLQVRQWLLAMPEQVEHVTWQLTQALLVGSTVLPETQVRQLVEVVAQVRQLASQPVQVFPMSTDPGTQLKQ